MVANCLILESNKVFLLLIYLPIFIFTKYRRQNHVQFIQSLEILIYPEVHYVFTSNSNLTDCCNCVYSSRITLL